MRLENPPFFFFFFFSFPLPANFFTLTNFESFSESESSLSRSESELELESESLLESGSLLARTILLITGLAIAPTTDFLVVSFTSGTPLLARSVKEFNDGLEIC